MRDEMLPQNRHKRVKHKFTANTQDISLDVGFEILMFTDYECLNSYGKAAGAVKGYPPTRKL